MLDGLLQGSNYVDDSAVLLAGNDRQRAAVTRDERQPKCLVEHVGWDVVGMGNVGDSHPRADRLVGAPARSMAEGLQRKCDYDHQGHYKAQDEQPLPPVDLARFCHQANYIQIKEANERLDW
jgi:hypothetical protein